MLKKILANSLKLLTGNSLASIISLINISLITKAVGLSGFGFFILCQSCYLLLEQIFNIRGWQLYLAKNKTGQNECEKLFSTNVYLSLIAIFVAMLIMLLSNIFYDFDQYTINMVLLYCSLIVFRNYDSAYLILRSLDRYGVLGSAVFCLSIVRFIFLLTHQFIFESPITVNVVIFIFVVTEAFYFVFLNLYCAYIKGNFFRLMRIDFCDLKDGFKINLTTIFDLPISTLDAFVVKYFYGDEVLGGYKLARKYITILGRVISPFNQVLFPELVKLERGKRNVFIFKVCLLTFLLSMVIFVSLFVSYYFYDLSIIRDNLALDMETLLLLLFLIEIIALSFSILNYVMIVDNKITENCHSVLISNLIFMTLLVVFCYLKFNPVITLSFAMSFQVISLILLRVFYLNNKRVMLVGRSSNV